MYVCVLGALYTDLSHCDKHLIKNSHASAYVSDPGGKKSIQLYTCMCLVGTTKI